ncbi:hypothetical protein HY415_03030 [Candidatus Kaiserbacteria bacterium]|nr:hypothetical protein [Candidatus Kaiserbacteria bacterium]
MNPRTLQLVGVGLLAVFVTLPFAVAVVHGDRNGQGLGIPFVESRVVSRDAQGRVKYVEVWAEGGICMAEVVFEGNELKIFLLSDTWVRGARHLGHVRIRDAQGKEVTDEFLRNAFRQAIKEYCLPLIVPGYAET